MSSEIGKGYRLLLVEDNALNRKIALAQLNTLGFAVETAEDGLEGVQAFERSAFDLILMDCEMPRMDGFEATKNIRAHEANKGAKRVPILALSGHAGDDIHLLCRRAGMDGHLFKPIELEALAAALTTWLKSPKE